MQLQLGRRAEAYANEPDSAAEECRGVQRTAEDCTDHQTRVRWPATDGECNRRTSRKAAVWMGSAVANKGMQLWRTDQARLER